ncbi:MAG: hypothetical protein HYU36_20795 [Planctomycetes bacterium]|nr:hypothetical protein [Planctomycetota bacterium]
MSNPLEPALAVRPRSICYINFAEHLLNAYNPNLVHPGLPYHWSDGEWFQFIDMIAGFGFNAFEFWLVPKLFSRGGLDSDFGREFARQMNEVVSHARNRGVLVEMLCPLTTVGADWRTCCPNDREEWGEVLGLWDAWTRRLPGLGIVGIFPGDPGGCSRNGCTACTYVDASIQVSEIIRRNLPEAEIEFGTWGPPFFGWGILESPPGWKGEFIPRFQHSGWKFDPGRVEKSMSYLVRRLPDFPPGTSVAINLGFNPDGNPVGEQDARAWAREVAKTHRILTWDFSLTEGENAIYPHYRFERLFRRRQEERAAAPYSGGICFTMTPRLNQLSLFEAARSFVNPEASPASLAGEFFEKLFGIQGRQVADRMPLFEIVPDWGHYAKLQIGREDYHRKMQEFVNILRGLEGQETGQMPFHPTPGEYRREMLFFAQIFADLSGPSPDYEALCRSYWERVYAIYDRLPEHVDPRPRGATERLVRFFSEMR